jgi:hypothetical protein
MVVQVAGGVAAGAAGSVERVPLLDVAEPAAARIDETAVEKPVASAGTTPIAERVDGRGDRDLVARPQQALDRNPDLSATPSGPVTGRGARQAAGGGEWMAGPKTGPVSGGTTSTSPLASRRSR